MNVGPVSLRAAAAHGLPAALPTEAERVLTREMIAVATNDRVQGLLWAAVEAGAVIGAGELIERAHDAHLAALRSSLVAEETTVLTVDALQMAGVDARILKGVAVAHLDHVNPSERVFGDADVLVGRRDYAVSLRALEAAGFTRRLPPVRSWWERRFGKAVVLYAPNGGELDLHLAITGGYFGARIDHDAIWSTRSQPFELCGRQVFGLDPEFRLLHACCHKVLGGASGWRVTRDVAQISLLSRADWRRTVAIAERDGSDLVVAEAVRTTWEQLQLIAHPLAEWASGHHGDAAQQRALSTYRGVSDAGWGPEGRGMLTALGPIDRALFLVGLALPSRASLRARQRSWHQHVGLGAATMRGKS